jgi:hypothetical protein
VKTHLFEPGFVYRRSGQASTSRSNCWICGKHGHQRRRVTKGRLVVYWQHDERPMTEPAPLMPCDWKAAGGLWCCKKLAHGGGHHAHRGERRDVGH